MCWFLASTVARVDSAESTWCDAVASGSPQRAWPRWRTGPGQTERREFEYRRHGTASVVAALDMRTGQVLGEDIVRNDSAAFSRFLPMLDQCIDAKLTIHLVLDNGSSHVS